MVLKHKLLDHHVISHCRLTDREHSEPGRELIQLPPGATVKFYFILCFSSISVQTDAHSNQFIHDFKWTFPTIWRNMVFLEISGHSDLGFWPLTPQSFCPSEQVEMPQFAFLKQKTQLVFLLNFQLPKIKVFFNDRFCLMYKLGF